MGLRLIGVLCLLAHSIAGYALSPAGLEVKNVATLKGSVAGVMVQVSSSAVFRVEEIIRLTNTWLDGSSVSVKTPDLERALTFSLTNTGNGDETFSLSWVSQAAGIDDFDPLDLVMWLEDNGIAGLQMDGIGPDIMYVSGINDPLLGADKSLVYYVVADIPDKLGYGDEGIAGVEAASLTSGAAGGNLGSVLTGMGHDGVDAIVAMKGGARAEANGVYETADSRVDVAKEIITTVDKFGSSIFMPETEVGYRITIKVMGAIAKDLVITDPVPNGTSFVRGSVMVDGVAQTDVDDADSADFDSTTSKAVVVKLGDVAGGTVRVVELKVAIK